MAGAIWGIDIGKAALKAVSPYFEQEPAAGTEDADRFEVMLALIQVYDKITAGQTPNPEWSAKLESISDKFRKLTQKAREVGTPAAPVPQLPTTSG